MSEHRDRVALLEYLLDVVVQLRVVRDGLRIAGPDLGGPVREDLAGRVFHDHVLGVEAEAAVKVVGVVGVDRRLDDLPRLHALLPRSWA